MSSQHTAAFSTAAFSPESVEDARRGHPAVDLAAYGRSRGLEPMGQVLIGHVAGLNPLWQDHVFNVLRGELGGGRFGTVQHELAEVGLADDGSPTQPGEYHGRRSMARPGLGALVGWRREAPNEPFGAQSMWLPATGCKVLVPEAALMPRLGVLTSTHHGLATSASASAIAHVAATSRSSSAGSWRYPSTRRPSAPCASSTRT